MPQTRSTSRATSPPSSCERLDIGGICPTDERSDLTSPRFTEEIAMNKFWFLQVTTGDWWSVADPVAWCLENARQPLLEPAREQILALAARPDPERLLKAVLRLCKLNLLEVPSSSRLSSITGPMWLTPTRS